MQEMFSYHTWGLDQLSSLDFFRMKDSHSIGALTTISICHQEEHFSTWKIVRLLET